MNIPEDKTKVVLASIVFLQGDDYTQMCQELDSEWSENDLYAPCATDHATLDYLMQWYDGCDEHLDQNSYDIEGINTPFLGYEREIGGAWYLFNHNRNIGYAGLSKIVCFE